MKRSPLPGETPPLLEFENITVFHGNKKVLDNLSITVCEGEHLAILGPNGAGKSSFIKTITRELYPLADGNESIFRVRGQEVWDVFEPEVLPRHRVKRSPVHVHPRNYLRDVVLSGFFSSVGLFNRNLTPAMYRKAGEIIDFLELGHLKDCPMTGMSSGECRRFLIGRALVHDPKTLVLDEPTNSLDLHALHTFRQTLRKIAQAGTGIILVTHQLHDIIPEVSRVVLMKEGRFIGDGPKPAMLTEERIGGLFQVPVRIREDSGYYYTLGY